MYGQGYLSSRKLMPMIFSRYIPLVFKLSPIAVLLFLAACATPPEYPNEPIIEFVSLSKDTLSRPLGGVDAFADSVLVTISFTDGDGDIGDIDTTLSLVFIDSRNGAKNDLKIPFVNEVGASSGIKGEISFIVNAQCCIFPDPFINPCTDVLPGYPYDPLTYDVYITDRAGNESNTVTTNTIFVKCFE